MEAQGLIQYSPMAGHGEGPRWVSQRLVTLRDLNLSTVLDMSGAVRRQLEGRSYEFAVSPCHEDSKRMPVICMTLIGCVG